MFHKKITVIGIAGGSGSGKTTLSQILMNALGKRHMAYIQYDSYYHDRSHVPTKDREKLNFDHPDTLDTPLLIQHILKLQSGRPVKVPCYDFKTHTRLNHAVTITPKPIILIEGILIYVDPELRKKFDLKIFIETDDDIRLIRRMERDIRERGRDMKSITSQYTNTVKPMFHQFVEPSKRYADLIIPGTEHRHAIIDVLLAWLSKKIQDSVS